MRELVRVRDLVQQGLLAVGDGYRMRNEELGLTGIPFVRGGDIGDGVINHKTQDHIRAELRDRVANKLTKPWDVAFITKGTVGRVGLLRPDQPEIVFAPQVAYWRSLDQTRLDPRFLFYLLRGPEFQANLDAVKTHGSMVADYVSISDQLDFRLSIPSPKEQRFIARALGALDDKIDLNRRMGETLEAMTRTLFKSWFVDFDPVRAKAEGRSPGGMTEEIATLFPSVFDDSQLGRIPRGWRVIGLLEIATRTKGRSYSSADLAKSDSALVTLKSFRRGGGYRTDGLKEFTGDCKPEQVVSPGELIIACTDVTQAAEVIGRVARVLPDVRYTRLIASLDTMIVRPKGGMKTSFLEGVLSTSDYVSHALGHTNGTTVLHLSADALSNYRFACPSTDLIDAFDAVTEPLYRHRVALEREMKILAGVRDQLLPRLLSGAVRAVS